MSYLQAFVGQIWVAIKERGDPPDDNNTLAAQLLRLWYVLLNEH